MQTIYRTSITNIGSLARDFLEHNMFIIFKDNAPDELKDYCYIHSENNLMDQIKSGDVLFIDQEDYNVTAVGGLVNQNLNDLGHITLKFSGQTDAPVAGTLVLEKKEIAPINSGTIIKIVRNK